MLEGTKDYSHSPVYTRFLTTSYQGQLLEITFTSNLNTDPKLKEEIDHIMDECTRRMNLRCNSCRTGKGRIVKSTIKYDTETE